MSAENKCCGEDQWPGAVEKRLAWFYFHPDIYLASPSQSASLEVSFHCEIEIWKMATENWSFLVNEQHTNLQTLEYLHDDPSKNSQPPLAAIKTGA